MPNGVEKNFSRLLMACAIYRQKYNEWPSQARLHPVILHDLAQLFDSQNFERLAAHLDLRTRDRMGLSVGGRGVVEYGERDADPALVEFAEKWLCVELRRDL
jgi:hypothetical protein